MLKFAGQEVYHNTAKKNAVITNTDTREYNDKYISSDFVMSRGDYIFYDNMFWILWNQVNVKRAENYKAVMRQCEHNIIFNLYYVGVTGKYLLKCPAFIQRTSDYTNYWVSTVETLSQSSEVHVFVRDTAETRKIMDLAGKGDGQIIVGGRNYDIIGVSIEKKGYLNITCRLGLKNSASDYENEVYWKQTTDKPVDWETKIDDRFYVLGEPEPTPRGTVTVKYVDALNIEIATSDTLTGDVGSNYVTTPKEIEGYTLKETPANASGVYINGTINVEYIYEVTVVPPNLPTGDELTDVTAFSYNSSTGKIKWTPEVKKDDFYGFWGYRVTYEYIDWGSPTQDVYNVTKEEIGGILFGAPSNKVYIESVFKDGATTVYMKKKTYTATEITSLPNI
ncbi:TPA: MucBP domain-containing protein [Bacillus cereus]|nr:MucBP domain-containing protein [Bacillus cereus]HDR8256327.1 MucBP domain-containing protein [Bacillus cereus]HDR8304824.1 MucBP domain-containing protein [Bacillus cereus]HDR8479626.1 MucBP domain-containing protein [Bacillus cereus]HDR8499824.1 MucBP domain-containing protein [Bacillus cereus]